MPSSTKFRPSRCAFKPLLTPRPYRCGPKLSQAAYRRSGGFNPHLAQTHGFTGAPFGAVAGRAQIKTTSVAWVSIALFILQQLEF